MNIKLLTEHHLEFLSLKGGCTGSSESTLVKMPHSWKSHVTAHMLMKCKANKTYRFIWKVLGLDNLLYFQTSLEMDIEIRS